MEHTNETKEHRTLSVLISQSNKQLLFAIGTENRLAALVKYEPLPWMGLGLSLGEWVHTACSAHTRLSTTVTYVSKELLETINIHRELALAL